MKRRLLAPALVLVALAAHPLASGRAGARDDVPPAAEWVRASRSGDRLTVRVAGTPLTLRLRPNDLVMGGADAPGVHLLEGDVEGDRSGWARVTVHGRLVIGQISTRAASVTIAPDPAGKLVATTESAVVDPGGIDAEESCDSLVWTPRLATPDFLVTGGRERTFDVAFAVDQAFVNQNPNHWQALALSLANGVDGIYRAAFSIRLSVVHLITVPDADLKGDTTAALLTSLQRYYVKDYFDLRRDNVHLFVARKLTGAAVGQVNCVGSAGRTKVSYSVGVGDFDAHVNAGPFVWFPDIPLKVTAHELAHTLSAHHHYANCAEPAAAVDTTRTMDDCTVMFNDVSLVSTHFGSLERLTVRGWADYYDI